jgi:L-amino acid N-acyltransferase YncA
MMTVPKPPSYRITSMQAEDWPAVEEIYRQGIATGNATFETETPSWLNWNAKHHPHSRLVARDEQGVLAWAALSPISARRVYAGVAEVSLYVAQAAQGQGIGKALLAALVEHSEENGIWTLQAGIFPENIASIALHKSCGFRQVGQREKIGNLGATWRNVLLLERRSQKVGK